jgi:hypothetical protein
MPAEHGTASAAEVPHQLEVHLQQTRRAQPVEVMVAGNDASIVMTGCLLSEAAPGLLTQA